MRIGVVKNQNNNKSTIKMYQNHTFEATQALCVIIHLNDLWKNHSLNQNFSMNRLIQFTKLRD